MMYLVDENEEPISIHYWDTKTGYRAARSHMGYFEDGDFVSYIWEEGNFACDCNRSLFLYGDATLPCNQDANQIIVEKIVRCSTGEVVYSDTDRV